MIKIESFAKPKKEGSISVTNYSSRGYANSAGSNKVKGVYIWGQYHDHSGNISGDLKDVKNITASGYVSSNSVSTNQIDCSTLDAYYIDSSTIETININSSSGHIDDLSTKNIQNSSSIKTTGLTVTDHANINTETVETSEITNLNVVNAVIDYLKSKDITVENLTVTKAAHFFKLIIDEIKASQGQIIITPANATIDYVEVVDQGWKCYFKATDGDKKIYQNFQEGDQVVCQTFNLAEGTNYDASNKFYWALVDEVSTETVDAIFDDTTEEVSTYHWIIISNSDMDENTNAEPAAGDEIVLLGNRYDTTRQSAITIGAYDNPFLDKDLEAPFIIQYDGINDYDLSTHRTTFFSKGNNSIQGSFKTNGGDDIETLINNMQKGSKSYLHIAYADNETGTVGFTKTYTDGKMYMGLCSNYTESDTDLVYSNYTWVRIKGDNGDSSITGYNYQYKIIPTTENLYINVGDYYDLVKQLYYQIICVSPTNPVPCTTLPDGYKFYYQEYYNNNTQSAVKYFSHSGSVWYAVKAHSKYDLSTGIDYIIVRLTATNSDGNDVVVDQRYVFPRLSASATLKITDEITATVTGNTQLIDDLTGKVTANTNSISTINQKYDEISLKVDANTTSISDINSSLDDVNSSISGLKTSVTTINNNVANLTIRYNLIQSTVSSHTTSITRINSSIGDLQSQVITNTTNLSDIIQKADEITSTVTEIQEGIRGDNVLEGTGSGYKWTLWEDNENEGEVTWNEPIYSTTGFQFTIPPNKWIGVDEDIYHLFSPPIQDYNGTYTLSFNAWQDNIQVKIYDVYPGVLTEPSTWFTGTNVTPQDVRIRLLATLNTSSNQVYHDDNEFDDDGNPITYDGKKLRYSSELGRYYYTFKEKSTESKWFGLEFNNTTMTLISGEDENNNKGENRYIQKIMVEPGEVPHKFEESYAVNQSLIKQTADNITLDASTVMVKNNGKLSALFENGKIKADWIGAIGGQWKIDSSGFVYNASNFDGYGNDLTAMIYPNGFYTGINESLTGSEKLIQYVRISPYSRDYNLEIMSGSQGAIFVDSVRGGFDDGLTIKHGVIKGMRGALSIEPTSGNTTLSWASVNIIANGGGSGLSTSQTAFGTYKKTIVLPSTATYDLSYSDYRDKYGKTPDTLTPGQEFRIWKRTSSTLTICTEDDIYYTNILVFRSGQNYTGNTSGVGSYTVPAAYYGLITIVWDGYYWNMQLCS